MSRIHRVLFSAAIVHAAAVSAFAQEHQHEHGAAPSLFASTEGSGTALAASHH
jgi:hypothetical protein